MNGPLATMVMRPRGEMGAILTNIIPQDIFYLIAFLDEELWIASIIYIKISFK